MTIARRILGAAALLAAALTASTTPSGSPAVAQPAQPTSVTLAGSFQSELGCPGDWLPECATPRLTYEAGDDVWSGTFAMPAGTWDYKAALNGTWTESYGRNGGPDNIPLSLARRGGRALLLLARHALGGRQPQRRDRHRRRQLPGRAGLPG